MTENAVRLSGIGLAGGAALLGAAIVWLSLNPVMNRVFSPGINLLLLLAGILLLVSLPGVYARQAASAGWLGLIGYVLLQVGSLLFVLIAAIPFAYPSLREPPGESLLLFVLGIALTVGLLLTGIATIQAGVYPRWAGILVLAATAGFFFVFFVAEFLPPIAMQVGSASFAVVLALALAWMGYAALMGQRIAVP